MTCESLTKRESACISRDAEMFRFACIANVKVTTHSKTGWGACNWDGLARDAQTPEHYAEWGIDEAKRLCPLVSAHGHRARHNTEITRARFGMLRLDLDDIPATVTPETLSEQLLELGIESFIIYSTLRHTPDAPRYRVFVELETAVDLAMWHELQIELAKSFQCDPCVLKPAQFMTGPATCAESKPHYVSLVRSGNPLGDRSILWINAKAAAEFEQCKVQKAETLAVALPIPHPYREPKKIGNQQSILALLETHVGWPELLASLGYTREGFNSWIAPESESGAAGVHLLTSNTDGRQRYYSHHSSDPAGGRLLDKLDLIAIRKHGGDSKAALAAVARELFPTVHAYNLSEWKTAKDNQRTIAAFANLGGAK